MADDYIRKADAVKAFGEEYVPRTDFERGMVSQMSCDKEKIKALPSADVVQVVHGHWIDVGSLSCRCDQCGCKSNKETRFCPNCGSKMDAQGEE